jgi:hypothetical protein
MKALFALPVAEDGRGGEVDAAAVRRRSTIIQTISPRTTS